MPGMGQSSPSTLPGFYAKLIGEGALWVAFSLLVVLVLVALASAHARRAGTSWWALGGPGGAGDPTGDPRGRSFLRVALGGLWIIDGLLQAQPHMPANFATQVIAPVAAAQPSWLADVMRWELYVWQIHPISLDLATIFIQIGLGLAIMLGRDSLAGRVGLWVSIGWSAVVWIGGEALGGLLVPAASVVFGAPGAVLFYALAAVLLLLAKERWRSGQVAKLARGTVGAVLVGGAVLQALPVEGFWSHRQWWAMLTSMAATPQPTFISTPIRLVAQWTASHVVLANSVVIAMLAVLGVGLLSGRGPRAWSWATGTWLLLVWWVGQDFGVLGGTGTDPNLAIPLVILLITAQLARRSPTPAAAPSADAKAVRTGATRVGGTREQVPAPGALGVSWSVWRLAGGLAGLAALAVGAVPTVFVVPPAVARPVALGTLPPPPATGLTVPLAQMAGQLNVGVLASRGRLQVSLQSPSLVFTSNGPVGSSTFRLSGTLQHGGSPQTALQWFGCGPGCFMANAHWSTGTNHLVLSAHAPGWQGGTVSFAVPWPPTSGSSRLAAVVAAMGRVHSVYVHQNMTSDPRRGPWIPYGSSMSGKQFLAVQPGVGLASNDVVVLSHSPSTTSIALGYPSQGVYEQMNINPQNQITSEHLITPQHLILWTFRYPS